jgi:hypothetical protein
MWRAHAQLFALGIPKMNRYVLDGWMPQAVGDF